MNAFVYLIHERLCFSFLSFLPSVSLVLFLLFHNEQLRASGLSIKGEPEKLCTLKFITSRAVDGPGEINSAWQPR